MGKVIRIFWRDLKRILRNPVAVIVTLGVCVIPSLYAWFNIMANWDPYENTQDVRVAVVNLDEGADAGGDLGFINAGDMVVEELGKNTQLKWVFLDEDTALEEVRSGRSYAAIVIPADFTQDLTSVLTGDLVSPDLTYYVNEKVNPIAPKVTDTGASTVETQINETFVSTVSNVVVGKLQDLIVSSKGDADSATTSIVGRVRGVKGTVDDLSTSMSDAQDTVAAARQTIEDAEATLDELDRISTNASGSLADATGVLFTSRDDATSLATSVASAVSDGSTRLSSISGTTNQAIGRVSGKIGQAQGTAEGALATAQSLVNQNRQLVQELQGLSSSIPESVRPSFDAAVAKISAQVDKEQATVDDLSRTTSDIGATNDAVAGLSSSVNDAIQTGTTSLSGVNSSFNQNTLPELYGALDNFSGAAQSLSGSLGGLSPTIAQTKAVLEQLDDTLEQTSTALSVTTDSLNDMSSTLDSVATDLSAIQSSEAMDRVNELLNLDANGIASFMSSPVQLDEEAVFPVSNYGSGVAPFYTNLALWVGGFVLIAIYKAEVDDEGIEGGFAPWQGYFGRLLLFLLLGVLQGVICTVGDLVIGIQCLDPKAFILAGVVQSFVYVNIIFAFAVAFKHIGKALCVLLVILQIPGSSGTYPIEMMPGFFRALNPWLPFTYGIRAMRETIAGYYGNYFGQNIFMLLLFVIPALLIGVGWRRHLLNINSLFDKKLAETDLMICERDGIEVEHYRLSSLIKALMHNDEYRAQIVQRAARFNAAYPRLIRVGFVLLLALPLGLSVVMFSVSNKLPWFIVWIVCLVLLCTALIIIEYFHESLNRKSAMVDLSKDEMYQLLGDQLDREYFSSPIERLRQRVSNVVAEAQARMTSDATADTDANDHKDAVGAQTTLVLRHLISERDAEPEVEVPTIVRGGIVTAPAAEEPAPAAEEPEPVSAEATPADVDAPEDHKAKKDHHGHKKHDKDKADKDKKRKKDKKKDRDKKHKDKDRKHKHGKKGDRA
jgi:putative membrane protein